MRDFHLDWIWSRYNTSPDPASGMQSLYQTCSAFTKHVLQPSHIILRGGGFTLCLELAVPLTDIVTSMDRLLYLAAKHIQLHSAPCIGQQELRTLTITEGLHACATYNQVVYGWVTLIDRLARAMRELQWLCIGEDPSRHSWSSWMPGILASLPPSLRAKLPSNFLESYNITVLPPPANISDAASQKAAARKCAESLSRSPMHCSHVSHSDVEAGGLASPEETKGSPRRRPETSEDVTSYANKSTLDNRTGRAPGSPDPSNATATTAVDLVHTGRDASMSELVNKFTSYPTPAVSLLARITCIVKLKLLGSLEITDRGEDLDRALLTRASSLVPGKTSCFLVDPHKFFTDTFRGTHDTIQLHNAWAALSDRMRAARDAVEQYRREYRNVHEVSADMYKESCKVELGPSLSVAQSRASSQGKDVRTASAVVTSGSSEPPAPQIEGRTPGERAHAPETAPALLTQASVFPPGVICSARMASQVVETHEERPQVAFANASRLDICADSTRGKSIEAGGLDRDLQRSDPGLTRATNSEHSACRKAQIHRELIPTVACASMCVLLPERAERAEMDESERVNGIMGMESDCAPASSHPPGSFASPRPSAPAFVLGMPLPKFPAPVLTVVSAVERGGLHREVAEPLTNANAVESGGRACFQMHNTCEAVLDQQSTNLQDDNAHIMDHMHTSCAPSPHSHPWPPCSSVKDVKAFAFVSAIVLTRMISYLVWILREDLEPYLAWAREGIGTPSWIC
ncbi:hypothetical protein B0H13DRAFT_2310477 [Mycena leptocephala]|nr:hypothetical protein B0H13DRAFT_2310477 [Mycena leptocephala]